MEGEITLSILSEMGRIMQFCVEQIIEVLCRIRPFHHS